MSPPRALHPTETSQAFWNLPGPPRRPTFCQLTSTLPACEVSPEPSGTSGAAGLSDSGAFKARGTLWNPSVRVRMRGRRVCRESRGRAQRRRPPPLRTRPGCGKRGCGPESLRAHLAVPAAWRPRRPGFQKVLCGHRGDAWGRRAQGACGAAFERAVGGGGHRGRLSWALSGGLLGCPGSRGVGTRRVRRHRPHGRHPKPQSGAPRDRRPPSGRYSPREVLPQAGVPPPPQAGAPPDRCPLRAGAPAQVGGGGVGSSFPSGSGARRLGGADGSPRERWAEAGTARCRGDPGAGARVRAQVWGPPGPPPPALQGHPIPREGWGAGVGGSGTFWRTLWPLRTAGCRPPRERGGHRVPPRICPSPIGAGNICLDSVPALFPSCS